MKGKLNVSMFWSKKERSLRKESILQKDNSQQKNDLLKKVFLKKDSLQLQSFLAELNHEELAYLIYKHHPQRIS